MLALAGVPLGIECVGLEPVSDPPMAAVSDVITASFGDRSALGELIDRVDVITVELEHVDIDALAWASERIAVRPSVEAIAISQDRLREKQFLRRCGLATAPFDVDVTGFPAIVKTRRGGFDGRGQVRVTDEAGLRAARAELPDPIVERVVSFRRELSVVAARSIDGTIAAYPLVENEHRDAILRLTHAPAAGVSRAMAAEADRIVRVMLEQLGYVGVIGVELFDTEDGLVVNEFAPRVHNSGHWTMDGAVTSQFEQHLRAVCGLPLGDPSPRGFTAMVNLIGTEPALPQLLAIEGLHLHRYGKSPRPGRKLGHVNVNANEPAALAAQLARAGEIIG